MRMKVFAVFVEPGLLGVVEAIDVDGLGIPIGFFAGNVVATLENQDALAGRRQAIGERAAPAPVPIMMTS